MHILFYSNTRSPISDFIDGLSHQEQARILACLTSIQELGFACPRVNFRQIERKLWEIKIKTPNGSYRIFYVTLEQKILVLLHAFKKQSQKTPIKELEIAKKRLKEVLKNESFYIK